MDLSQEFHRILVDTRPFKPLQLHGVRAATDGANPASITLVGVYLSFLIFQLNGLENTSFHAGTTPLTQFRVHRGHVVGFSGAIFVFVFEARHPLQQ